MPLLTSLATTTPSAPAAIPTVASISTPVPLVNAPNSTLAPNVQASPTASPTVAATPAATTAATTAATPAATTDPATAAGASTDSGSGSNHKGKGGLPGWAIAVIVVAALLALLALASKTSGQSQPFDAAFWCAYQWAELAFGAVCCLFHNLAKALPCQAACACIAETCLVWDLVHAHSSNHRRITKSRSLGSVIGLDETVFGPLTDAKMCWSSTVLLTIFDCLCAKASC